MITNRKEWINIITIRYEYPFNFLLFRIPVTGTVLLTAENINVI